MASGFFNVETYTSVYLRFEIEVGRGFMEPRGAFPETHWAIKKTSCTLDFLCELL